jgi:plasmid replication initiation protein
MLITQKVMKNTSLLLTACLVQIKSNKPLDPNKFFVITADDLASMTGSKGVNNYRELEIAANELLRMCVTVYDLPNGKHGKPSYEIIKIVSACEYHYKEGKIILTFTSDIVPYISDLKSYLN